MAPQCLITGGGLAGLAAACGLASNGIRVTLLESRPRLGGRASSFEDGQTGEVIDNCQHVAMKCCTAFQSFASLVGIEDQLRTEKTLYFVDRQQRVTRFEASRLPAPLHLAPAFARLPYLTWSDRFRLSSGLRRLARMDPQSDPEAGLNFRDWLHRHGQPQALIDRVWHTVLVSALSEDLDRIETRYARKVFVDGFLANRTAWEVQVPTTALDQLYGPPVIRFLEEHGATVRIGEGVQQLAGSNSHITRAELRSGESIEADDFVLAVPWNRVADLLPVEIAENPAIRSLSQIQAAPISSVHLWFDEPITNLPHAVFVDGISHWLFSRGTKPEGEMAGTSEGYYYQVVISASRKATEDGREQLIEEVVDELRHYFPESRDVKLLNSRIVTEHKAVFSVLPGIDELRPPQQTSVPNLQLAGDWTQTGWPATMEGGVRSGFLAAENVLRRHGIDRQLVPDDLPVGLLSKWLYRL